MNGQKIQACNTCKYFVVQKQDLRKGTCHRNPPQVNLLVNPPHVMVRSDFPPVEGNELCG